MARKITVTLVTDAADEATAQKLVDNLAHQAPRTVYLPGPRVSLSEITFVSSEEVDDSTPVDTLANAPVAG
jgi:hypothetical protein